LKAATRLKPALRNPEEKYDMTRLRCAPLVAIFTVLFSSFSAAADFVVAPAGNDASPGTAAEPFATITRARDAVRAKIAAGLTGPVTVQVHGGTYRVTQPIVFSEADGGTEEHSISYVACPGERPVISGGRVIGGWQVQADGTWKTTIAQVKSGEWNFRQLYVDGQRAPRARHPNSGYLRVEQTGADRRTNFRYKSSDLKSYPDVENIELVFLHDWSISRVPLKSIDESTRTLTVQHQVGGPSRWAVMNWFEPHPRYYLENSAEFLDEPGEWFLDRTTGDLTYFPRSGERPDKTQIVAPVAEQLLAVRGHTESGRPVRNLHFVGLCFEHTSWAPPRGVYWGRQACTYSTSTANPPGATHLEADPAAVQFDLAERCSVRDGRVQHTGASGLWFGRACRHNRVEGNVVSDTGGNGIMIGEGQTRLVDGKPWWQAAPEQAAADNVVSNNVVRRCGQELFGAVGAWLGLAARATITHNEVSHHPYTGISIGWMWWNPRSRPEPRKTPCEQTLVADNHIHHCMLTLSDGGGIYSLGNQPDSVIRGNLIHDIPENVGRAESNGMFLDQGTGGFTIEQNVIYRVPRSPLRFHKGWHNVVRNNVLQVRPGVPTVRYNDTVQERIRLENNTVVEQIGDDMLDTARRRAGLQTKYRGILPPVIDARES
jgi:hypothetical protein